MRLSRSHRDKGALSRACRSACRFSGPTGPCQRRGRVAPVRREVRQDEPLKERPLPVRHQASCQAGLPTRCQPESCLHRDGDPFCHRDLARSGGDDINQQAACRISVTAARPESSLSVHRPNVSIHAESAIPHLICALSHKTWFQCKSLIVIFFNESNQFQSPLRDPDAARFSQTCASA